MNTSCFARRILIVIITALTMGCSTGVLAQDNRGIPLPNYEQESKERVQEDDIRDDDALAFPPLPRGKSLFEFLAGSDTTKFRYFIELDSISMGKDEIVRYVVVLNSGRANNIYYEGIDCRKRLYKTYGFASSAAKRFRPFRNPLWRQMRETGDMNFRWVMLWEFVCDDGGQPLGQVEIKQRIEQRAFKSDVDG